MDWVGLAASESAEERAEDMFGLATGLVSWMRKHAASAQGETTPSFEVPCGKRPKQSGPDEEAQNSAAVITMDSPECASDVLPDLEGVAQDFPRKACALLEDGVLAGVPPNADRVTGEAPLEMVAELLFSVKLVNAGPRRLRGPNRVVLNSPVIPMKWDQPLTGTLVPGPDVVKSIINH